MDTGRTENPVGWGASGNKVVRLWNQTRTKGSPGYMHNAGILQGAQQYGFMSPSATLSVSYVFLCEYLASNCW
jgi:hypothetical protein